MRVWQRFGRRDVKASGAKVTRPQGVNKRVLVDEATARRVDQDGPGAHSGKLRRADQVTGCRREWAVQRDDVGDGKHLVQAKQRHRANARHIYVVGLHKRIVRNDLQAETRRLRRDLSADVADPNEAEHLTLQPSRVRDVAHGPPALADARGVRNQLAVQREQQDECLIADLIQAVRRRVADKNAEVGRGGDVHHVDANSGTNDGLEARKLLERFPREVNPPFDDDVDIRALFDDFRGGFDPQVACPPDVGRGEARLLNVIPVAKPVSDRNLPLLVARPQCRCHQSLPISSRVRPVLEALSVSAVDNFAIENSVL